MPVSCLLHACFIPFHARHRLVADGRHSFAHPGRHEDEENSVSDNDGRLDSEVGDEVIVIVEFYDLGLYTLGHSHGGKPYSHGL